MLLNQKLVEGKSGDIMGEVAKTHQAIQYVQLPSSCAN